MTLKDKEFKQQNLIHNFLEEDNAYTLSSAYFQVNLHPKTKLQYWRVKRINLPNEQKLLHF
jgi:hypothetical protein